MADVRGSLAAGLAEAVTPEKVQELVEAALTAKKTDWREVRCKKCSHVAKYPIEVGDPATAAKVLQIVAEQGLGKAASASSGPDLGGLEQWELDRLREWKRASGAALSAFSDDELRELSDASESALFWLLSDWMGGDPESAVAVSREFWHRFMEWVEEARGADFARALQEAQNRADGCVTAWYSRRPWIERRQRAAAEQAA